MDLYTLTLKAVRAVLEEIGQDAYLPVVDECINKWEKDGDCDSFRQEFEKGGRFADFKISSKTARTPEIGFWSAQVFSALLAMNAQLADFRKKGLRDDMGFIRRNFGAANEVLEAGRCAECDYREATASDIDKYVSRIVVAKRIVSGMENGNLEDEARALANMTCPDIERERRKTILRMDNSGIIHSNVYHKLERCPKCGAEQIVSARYLRSLRENVFVPLSQ